MSSRYNQIVENLGNSNDNIKVISGFLSKETCNEIIAIADSKESTNLGLAQWNDMVLDVTSDGVFDDYFEKIKLINKDFFGSNVEMNNDTINVVRWTTGTSMGPHMDDHGMTIYNHIASIVYLNDDYTGGELRFLDQKLSLSPKAGDLVVFPGNKNYEHEVSVITSGERYTIPLWSRFDIKP